MTMGAAPVPVLDRPDLHARIRSALDAGSVLLIADGGFGKTTALNDALDGDGAAWVSTGDAGGDAGRLLQLIIEAIRGVVPGAVDVLAERMQGAPEQVDPERAASELSRELERLLVDPLVLCLDDAETLERSPAALAVVGRLVGGGSRMLRLAVASRRPLGLRVAKERAAGRVTELGPAELAFSAADCEDYLRLVRGNEPAPEEVDSLMEETEGWPLGVVLAGTGAEPRGPSRPLLDAYFEEEVLSTLSAADRRQLLAAATAPDLRIADAAGIDLESDLRDRRGLFLRGAGEHGGEAFHPLFREFLRRRFAEEVPPPDRRAIAAQLADALEAQGRGAEAVDQRIASEEWDRAAAAVAREGGSLVRRAPETVEGWLAALPNELAERPELMLLAGQLSHGQGSREAVEQCRAAAEGFDKNGAPPFMRFAARFALADAYLAAGDLAAAAALGDVLDDPAADGDLTARAVAALATVALALQGRFEQAQALRDRALADPVAAVIRGQSPLLEGYWIDLPAGRLDDALIHVDQALAAFEQADPFGRMPYVLLFKGAVHDERGEDDEALAFAARGRELARRAGLSGWVGTATAIRSASLLARRGDLPGADAHLVEVGPTWQEPVVWELEATRAVIAAARGDDRAARAAAERAIAHAHDRWVWFDRMRCAAILAPALVQAGHPARAREVVEHTMAAQPEGFSGARLGAVLAWLLHEEGDEAGSVAALAGAWAEAGDQAHHVVRREWPRVEQPLWAALEQEAVDPVAAIGAVASALPGGSALAAFTRHPMPGVRRAALLAAVAAGHPEAIERLPEFDRDPDPDVARAAQVASRRLHRNPPRLRFRLFGAFELQRGSWIVDDAEWKRRVAARLVRLLLCRSGEPVTEDELIEAFWPDKNAAAGRRSLQVAVSAARGVLDVPGAESSRLVAGEHSYRIALADGDRVDVSEFERAAEAALVAGERRRSALTAAAGMWGGEPLPEERYADWAIPWRERLMDRYAAVLAALADEHAGAGNVAAAADVARRLVELDPVNEAAHRQLIVAYARAGQRGHALRQYLACRRALVADLGVEPGEQTVALQRRVLAGDAV